MGAGPAEAELAEQAVTEVLEVVPEGVPEVAQVAPEVQEQAALGEAMADLPVAVRALEVRKAQRPGNGSRRQHCCALARQRVALAVPWAWAAGKRAVARTRSPKRMLEPCLACSRNWANRAKIRKHAWKCQLFNRD